MTLSASTNPKATSADRASTRTIVALAGKLRGLIVDHLEPRNADKPRAFFRNPKDIQLERAQHDVNKLWRGQI